MKTTLARLLTAVGLLALLTTVAASADESAANMKAGLSGFNEVPPKATGGNGTFKAKASNGAIDFTLTYSGLSSPVTVAHIHFGKVHVAGGVIVFFCGGGGQGDCPPSGTVTGTITAGNVQAIPGQNVTAGDFDALEDALTTNTAYANVHTSNFPAGEIRGQVRGGDDDN